MYSGSMLPLSHRRVGPSLCNNNNSLVYTNSQSKQYKGQYDTRIDNEMENQRTLSMEKQFQGQSR